MAQTKIKAFNNIAILGLGRSGQAVLDACACDGITVSLYDDHFSANRRAGDTAEKYFKHYDDWDMDKLDALIISPGIPHNYPEPHPAAKVCIEAGIPILSEVEFALRRGRKGRWVSITGTNGKSTTTALIGHILEQAGLVCAIGGNIGAAVTALETVGADGVNIIELSSYQLEVTPSLRSDIAVIMNITPDHLDRHGGMQGYITAKEQVLASLAPEGLAILGEGAALDNLSKKYEGQLRISRLADGLVAAEASHINRFNNLALKGMHNAQNCLAARGVCRALGLSDTQIDAGIESFSGLPHRLQPAGQIDNILFVNDSKATNGEAAAHALASFDNIHWCAGGIAKEDGLEACLPHLQHVVQSYLYGACANDFANSLQGLVPVSCFETLEEAIQAASASAQKRPAPDQQVILLSPAAASFDQFPSFEARGQHFCALAAAHVAKRASPPASPDSFGGRHV